MFRTIVIILSALSLASCGGGGGSSEPTPAPAPVPAPAPTSLSFSTDVEEIYIHNIATGKAEGLLPNAKSISVIVVDTYDSNPQHSIN